jgi:hypothetical protein
VEAEIRAFGRKGDWLGRMPCLSPFLPNALRVP